MTTIALKYLQDADLASADAILVVHVIWAPQRTPGMRVIDDRGVVLVDSGLPCDTFNFICRARLEVTARPSCRRPPMASACIRIRFQPFGKITEDKPPIAFLRTL